MCSHAQVTKARAGGVEPSPSVTRERDGDGHKPEAGAHQIRQQTNQAAGKTGDRTSCRAQRPSRLPWRWRLLIRIMATQRKKDAARPHPPPYRTQSDPTAMDGAEELVRTWTTPASGRGLRWAGGLASQRLSPTRQLARRPVTSPRNDSVVPLPFPPTSPAAPERPALPELI